MLRTHDCGALRAEHVGAAVRLAGWVATVRDHGGVVFVDLRDRYGRTQTVVSPDAQPALADAARALGVEYVVQVAGTVRARAPEARNPRMATGDVEVAVESLAVLSPARTPPFEIDTPGELDFALRMRHRSLDLRRPEPQRLLQLRSAVADHIRRHLADRGFLEIETPILFKSTPEGAREFLVPSRLNHGKFYALPQSPQQFKQLLMVAGMDRYFQLARCFRDEDPRVDRQWEFTQLDLEASFVERDDVLGVIETLYLELWDRFAPAQRLQERPFPRLRYADAMRRFGSDKPDLRYGCEHHDVTALFREAGPVPLREAAARGGEVRALAVPARGRLSRKKIDALEAVAKAAGAGGLGWLDCDGDPPRGNLAKGLAPGQAAALAQAVGREAGDLIFLVAGSALVAAEAGDAVRRAAAAELALVPAGVASFAWIVDFPLFLRDPEDTRWVSSHHPFTAPQPEDLGLLESDPGRVRSWQYDLTCNGLEIAGGSIRIHDPALQQRVFAVLGLSPEHQQRLFGHLLEAFSFGTPPHGGIAAGLDRLVALLGGTPAIREVIAFPKTARGQDLMSGAPSPVTPAQLAELGIAVAPSSEAPPAASAGGAGPT